MSSEQAGHFYVDQDGYGEPCVWYGKGPDDSDDKLILRKFNLDREGVELWPMVSAALVAGSGEKVADFCAERAGFITAINNCHPDNVSDYHRWQGHAEARRQLSERLGLPVAWPAEVSQ